MATKLTLKDDSGLGSLRGPLTSAMAGTQSARRRQMQLQVKLQPNPDAHGSTNEDDSDVLSDLHGHSSSSSSSSSHGNGSSSASTERFKMVEKELSDSIPDKDKTLMKDWKVKQLVISKPDTSNFDLPLSTSLVGHEGKQQVSRSPAMQAVRRLSRQGTSKIQKFKPSVSLAIALQWLSEYGRADSTVIFENNCAIMYVRGRFSEFEDVRDEEEEEQIHMEQEEDS